MAPAASPDIVERVKQVYEYWTCGEPDLMVDEYAEDGELDLDVGEGHFVVALRLWGKGRRSGVEVDQRAAFLYTLRESDGKVVRALLFPTVQDAVDYVGAESPETID